MNTTTSAPRFDQDKSIFRHREAHQDLMRVDQHPHQYLHLHQHQHYHQPSTTPTTTFDPDSSIFIPRAAHKH